MRSFRKIPLTYMSAGGLECMRGAEMAEIAHKKAPKWAAVQFSCHLRYSFLEINRISILWFCSNKIVIQVLVEEFKRRPVMGIILPRWTHDSEQRVWTVDWLWHTITTLNLLQDFLVRHACNKWKNIDSELWIYEWYLQHGSLFMSKMQPLCPVQHVHIFGIFINT